MCHLNTIESVVGEEKGGTPSKTLMDGFRHDLIWGEEARMRYRRIFAIAGFFFSVPFSFAQNANQVCLHSFDSGESFESLFAEFRVNDGTYFVPEKHLARALRTAFDPEQTVEGLRIQVENESRAVELIRRVAGDYSNVDFPVPDSSTVQSWTVGTKRYFDTTLDLSRVRKYYGDQAVQGTAGIHFMPRFEFSDLVSQVYNGPAGSPGYYVEKGVKPVTDASGVTGYRSYVVYLLSGNHSTEILEKYGAETAWIGSRRGFESEFKVTMKMLYGNVGESIEFPEGIFYSRNAEYVKIQELMKFVDKKWNIQRRVHLRNFFP